VRFLPALLLFSFVALGDVRDCACDPASATGLAGRECSLCREAEKQPPGPQVFFLKDISPYKPHRWLALPRPHIHALPELSRAQRLAFWTGAIQKAHELWGDDWGIAVNSDARRSQCHLHAHIGKLSADAETPDFLLVDGPAAIPVPYDGSGLLIHPVQGKLHVHTGEDAPETLL